MPKESVFLKFTFFFQKLGKNILSIAILPPPTKKKKEIFAKRFLWETIARYIEVSVARIFPPIFYNTSALTYTI
jgi:hypothetical protein